VSDRHADYLNTMNRAAAAAATLGEITAGMAAATRTLEQWLSAHVPHQPWQKRTSHNPPEELPARKAWEDLLDALEDYRKLVRTMDRHYDAMSPVEKVAVGGPPAPPPAKE
jgi:hypothetical protein